MLHLWEVLNIKRDVDLRFTLLDCKILFHCRIPLGPTTNKMYMPVATRGKSRFVRTKEYKTWQQLTELVPIPESIRAAPIGSPESPVGIMLVVHGHDIDIDNCAKAHIDFLVRRGVITDDDISVVKAVLVFAGSPLQRNQCIEIVVYPAAEFNWHDEQRKFIF